MTPGTAHKFVSNSFCGGFMDSMHWKDKSFQLVLCIHWDLVEEYVNPTME